LLIQSRSLRQNRYLIRKRRKHSMLIYKTVYIIYALLMFSGAYFGKKAGSNRGIAFGEI